MYEKKVKDLMVIILDVRLLSLLMKFIVLVYNIMKNIVIKIEVGVFKVMMEFGSGI